MRNYQAEIEELTEDIRDLDVQRTRKKKDLQHLLKERQSKQSNREEPIVDKEGEVISKGDWVKAATKGKFIHDEGTVVNIKKWVTFTDTTGVKQIRAPNNVIVSNNARKGNRRRGNASDNLYRQR